MDARYALAIKKMADGFILLDAQHRIVDVNITVEKLLGRQVTDLVGQLADEIFSPWPELVERYVDLPEIHQEISLSDPEGHLHILDLQISPLVDRSEQFIGTVISFQDISDRKQMESALRDQRRLFESLVEVARATTERLALEATLQNTLDVSVTLTGAGTGSIFLLDPAGVVTHSILARASASLSKRRELLGQVMNQGLAGWVARHRQPALIEDVTQDERWFALPEESYTVRAALTVPIVRSTLVLGIVTLMHPEPGHFNTEHLQLMQASADQMSLALSNAQIYEAQRRMTDMQTTLYEVIRTLGGHLDPDTVIRVAVETIARLTGWTRVSIFVPLQDDGHLKLAAAAGAPYELAPSTIPVPQGVLGRVFQTAQTVYIRDVAADPACAVDDSCVQSCLAVPLRRGEQILGVLNLEADRVEGFDADEVLLAESLAEAVALTLDNAQLYALAQRELLERKRAEAALQQQKNFNESIVTGVAEAIMLEDANGYITFANPATTTLLGFSREELIGRHWRDLIPESEFDKVRREVAKRPLGIASRYEVLLKGADDRLVPGIISARPLFEDDKFAGVLFAVTDITERKKAEQERERLIMELDAFAHTVAHDLKNPLANVISASSMLQGDYQLYDKDQLGFIIQAIMQGSYKMRNIIDELLLLASVRQMDDIPMAPLDMAEIVEEALQRLAYMIEEYQAEIIVPDVWAVAIGYGPWVEEVWTNYISNAIKYGGQPPRVELGSTNEGLTQSGQVRFWVKDNGVGLTSELRGRLFAPFTRLDRLRATGHGLGLSIVRRIIEKLEGQVSVESEVGRGSVFSFTLPGIQDRS